MGEDGQQHYKVRRETAEIDEREGIWS